MRFIRDEFVSSAILVPKKWYLNQRQGAWWGVPVGVLPDLGKGVTKSIVFS